VLLNNHGDAFLEARGYEYLLQKSHWNVTKISTRCAVHLF
jgi:hypothetical protein